jgi:hypothetical protein
MKKTTDSHYSACHLPVWSDGQKSPAALLPRGLKGATFIPLREHSRVIDSLATMDHFESMR